MYPKKIVADSFISRLEELKDDCSKSIDVQTTLLESFLDEQDFSGFKLVGMSVKIAIILNGKPYALDHTENPFEIVKEAVVLANIEADIVEEDAMDDEVRLRTININAPCPTPDHLAEFLKEKKDLLLECFLRSLSENETQQ